MTRKLLYSGPGIHVLVGVHCLTPHCLADWRAGDMLPAASPLTNCPPFPGPASYFSQCRSWGWAACPQNTSSPPLQLQLRGRGPRNSARRTHKHHPAANFQLKYTSCGFIIGTSYFLPAGVQVILTPPRHGRADFR